MSVPAHVSAEADRKRQTDAHRLRIIADGMYAAQHKIDDELAIALLMMVERALRTRAGEIERSQ